MKESCFGYFRSFAIAVLCTLLLTGCEGNVLEPKGPVGAAESNILIISSIIMLAIIVPTIIGTLAFAWWYRASNDKAQYRPDFAYSGRVELVVWSVPFLTIIFLGAIAWVGAHDLDPAKALTSSKKPLEVQAVSLDWKWLFIYPEQHVAAVNQLVVPAATPVHYTLISASVWDSFFVPQLGSQIYTMKGMTTQLYMMSDAEGTFHGLSTHFSGDGFSDMNFVLKAVSDDAFAAWVKQTRGGGPTLDEASYAQLAKQSIADPPSTYASIDPALFDRIVAEKVPSGPGPTKGSEGAVDITPKGGS